MKKSNVILILSILSAVSVTVMVLALCFGQPRTQFTPPPFEANAEPGMPEVPEQLGYQELDVQVFRVLLCGEVRTGDGAAEIWFTNPVENTVWLKLRILDEQGNILGETGILRPGEYVRRVELTSTPETGTPVMLKVMAYEPETYYGAGSLLVNTVTVSE